MKQKLRLSIPTPCHEDWEKMLPVERGRHCEQCCKTVVDFTGMSDEEVVKYFVGRARGGVCGRFAPDQLGRELAPAPVQRNGVKGWPWVVAGALVLGGGPEDGPRSVTGAVGMKQARGLREMPDTTAVVPDTSMLVRDTTLETVTTGIPIMTIGTIGVDDTDAIVAPDTMMMPDAIVSARANVKSLKGVLGEMVLVGDTVLCSKPLSDTVSRIKFGIDTVVNWWKDSVAGVATALGVGSGEMVKLFPNPVMRGGVMKLAWSAAGKYSAAILDLHGQIVQERVGEASGTGQVDEWVLPNGLAAGVYFLRVVRPGEKVWTKEIMVQ
jgi:hypothetical protein